MSNNPNNRIVFRRVFEWGSETQPEPGARYIAYWDAPHAEASLDEVSICAYPGFQQWCADNLLGQWGLKLVDYSEYHVWFFNKTDAQKFLEHWY